MWEVLLERKAKKQLAKVPIQHREKMETAITQLAIDPFIGKKLRGSHKGEYSLRVWPYRIIYTIKRKRVTVYVLAIGHRQGVY